MLKMLHYGFVALMLFVSTLLAGCGGGGGSSSSTADATPAGPVTSTLSFPLQSAYKAFIAAGVAAGASKTLTVSITALSATTGKTVTCSGTGNQAVSPATTPATFEGKPALSAASTATISMVASTGCNAVTNATTITTYFDSNYVDLGHNTVGGNYGVYLTAPSSLPTSVKVGDTAIYGTETLYTNSTKATGAGTNARTFIIEADTATTAIFNAITTVSDAAGKVTSTTQGRYRITAVGALTPITGDVQYSDGSKAAFVYQLVMAGGRDTVVAKFYRSAETRG